MRLSNEFRSGKPLGKTQALPGKKVVKQKQNMLTLKNSVEQLLASVDALTSISDEAFSAMPEGEQEANIRAAESLIERIDSVAFAGT